MLLYLRNVGQLPPDLCDKSAVSELFNATFSRLQGLSRNALADAIVEIFTDIANIEQSVRSDLIFSFVVPLIDDICAADRSCAGLIAAAAAAAPVTQPVGHSRSWLIEVAGMFFTRLQPLLGDLRCRATVFDVDLGATVSYAITAAALRTHALWLPKVLKHQASHPSGRRVIGMETVPGLHAAAAGATVQVLEPMLMQLPAGTVPAFGMAQRRLGPPFTPLDVATLCSVGNTPQATVAVIKMLALKWPSAVHKSLRHAIAMPDINADVLDALISVATAEDLSATTSGRDLLEEAALAGNSGVLSALIRASSAPDLQRSLVSALSAAQPECVSILLDAGADPCQRVVRSKFSSSTELPLSLAYSAAADASRREEARACASLLVQAGCLNQFDTLVIEDAPSLSSDSRPATAATPATPATPPTPPTARRRLRPRRSPRQHDDLGVLLSGACVSGLAEHVSLLLARGADAAGSAGGSFSPAETCVRGEAELGSAASHAECLRILLNTGKVGAATATSEGISLGDLAEKLNAKKCSAALKRRLSGRSVIVSSQNSPTVTRTTMELW